MIVQKKSLKRSNKKITLLKCRESEDKDIWAKISIAKSRFDVWPIFANFREFSRQIFSLVVKDEVVFLEIVNSAPRSNCGIFSAFVGFTTAHGSVFLVSRKSVQLEREAELAGLRYIPSISSSLTTVSAT